MNRLLAMALMSMALGGQSLQIGSVAPEKIEQRLRAAPEKNPAREMAIAGIFRDAGCPAEQLQLSPLPHSRFSNVICTLPGNSDEVIVVGGHFDHVSVGDGIVDNWSGASMVANMIESLHSETRKHTFVFVAFAQEEEGLRGSRWFVSALNKEHIADVKAMVNMDSLGVGPAVVWRSHADPALFALAEKVAGLLQVKLQAVNVDGAGDSDSSPFREKKIPVIDFHSLHPETFHILHSKEDNFNAVRMDDFLDSFRFIATYLAYLDLHLD